MADHELEEKKLQWMYSQTIYQQVNMQGQGALRAALLINGGASVAMLAFIGSTNVLNPEMLLMPLRLFVIATFCCGLASASAYLTGLVQQPDFEEKDAAKIAQKESTKKKRFWVLNVVTIILIIISYVLFACGSYKAYNSFHEIRPQGNPKQNAQLQTEKQPFTGELKVSGHISFD